MPNASDDGPAQASVRPERRCSPAGGFTDAVAGSGRQGWSARATGGLSLADASKVIQSIRPGTIGNHKGIAMTYVLAVSSHLARHSGTKLRTLGTGRQWPERSVPHIACSPTIETLPLSTGRRSSQGRPCRGITRRQFGSRAWPGRTCLPGRTRALHALLVDGSHQQLASKVTESSRISCKSSRLQAPATTDTDSGARVPSREVVLPVLAFDVPQAPVIGFVPNSPSSVPRRRT
jgi:hypothetical protein